MERIEIMKKTVAALQEPFIQFCQKIVQIPSMSGDEKEVAGLVIDEMKKLGYEKVFQDDWGNVVGIIHGMEAGPSIMYNGHMDTVTPGDLDKWEGYDPFGGLIDVCPVYDWKAEFKENVPAIHGRGTSDMKTGLATQIYTGAVLARLKAAGLSWKGTFILTAIVLEENGEMMGTVKLTEGLLKEKNIAVDGMICAEPSALKLMLGHRGRMEVRVRIQGRSCHGSSPWLGINAAEKAAKFITAVTNKIRAEAKRDEHLGTSGMTLTMVTNEPNALCIVPNLVTLIFDRRLVPGETVQSALAQFQEVADMLAAGDSDFHAVIDVNTNVRTAFTGKYDEIKSQKEAWELNQQHPFAQACAKALEAVGEPVHFSYWAFSTDCPQLGTVMNKPVIGFSGGQEVYAHTVVERARIDYLQRALVSSVSMYLHVSELDTKAFMI